MWKRSALQYSTFPLATNVVGAYLHQFGLANRVARCDKARKQCDCWCLVCLYLQGCVIDSHYYGRVVWLGASCDSGRRHVILEPQNSHQNNVKQTSPPHLLVLGGLT